MAMAIATFKVGTRRTIFSFYLFIVVYLVGGYLLDRVDFFHLTTWTLRAPMSHTSTSWLTALNPFLALRVIFKDQGYMPPNLADLPAEYQAWPMGWYWTEPGVRFTSAFMFFLSLAMMVPSVLLLRRLAQSTTSLQELGAAKAAAEQGATGRASRGRSGTTRSPGGRPRPRLRPPGRRSCDMDSFLAGMTGAVVLLVMHSSEIAPQQFINHSYDPAKNTLYIEGNGHYRKSRWHPGWR